MAEYNAGYEIIKAEDIGNSRIVLGRNKYRHYVTWSHNQTDITMVIILVTII